MATLTTNYAAAASITVTLTSLADSGYRESTAIDNTSNKYVDALVGGIIQIGAPTADGNFSVYAYGSYDGTEYTQAMSGSDAGITWGTTPANSGVDGYLNLPLLGVVAVDATDDSKDIRWGPFRVASAFGGVLPSKWGLVFRNQTGASFHATGTNNECQYIGVKFDIA